MNPFRDKKNALNSIHFISVCCLFGFLYANLSLFPAIALNKESVNLDTLNEETLANLNPTNTSLSTSACPAHFKPLIKNTFRRLSDKYFWAYDTPFATYMKGGLHPEANRLPIIQKNCSIVLCQNSEKHPVEYLLFGDCMAVQLTLLMQYMQPHGLYTGFTLMLSPDENSNANFLLSNRPSVKFCKIKRSRTY